MWLRLVAALAFCAAFLVNGGTASATSGWVIVPGVSPTGNDGLGGVAALSPTDAWAVGDSRVGQIDTPLIEQWNGTTWSLVSSPAVGVSAYLNSIAALSPTDIWAVGSYFDASFTSHTLTEHWNGTQWSVVPSPDVGYSGVFLTSVSAISSTDVWAVGNTDNTMTMSMHWDGMKWSIAPLSIPPGAIQGSLYGVSAVGPHDVWAVGSWRDINNFYGLSEHWNGTAWKYVSTANNLYAAPLTAIAHLTGPRMLAVADGLQEYAEQWDGSSWALLPSPTLPSGSRLSAITASPTAGIWSVGNSNSGTLTLHGSTVVPSPNSPLPNNVLGSVSIVPGTQDVWAVGASYSPTVSDVLIEYYSP